MANASVSFTIDASGAKAGATEITTAVSQIQRSLQGLAAESKKIQAEINATFNFPNVNNAIKQVESLQAALGTIKFPNLAIISDEFKTLSTQMTALATNARMLAVEMKAVGSANLAAPIQAATASTKELSTTLGNTIPFLKSMAYYLTAEGFVDLGKGVYEATNNFQAFSASLNATAENSAEAKSQMGIVSQTVMKLGLDMHNTQESFGKFFASAKLSGADVKTIDTIFTDMSEAMTVFGLNAQRQQYVWLALEQMFNKGTVQMQELKRQLGDQLPAAFEVFAKSAGYVGANGVRDFTKAIENGQIGSDKILGFAEAYKDAFAKGLPEALERASVAVGRLGSAFNTFLIGIGTSGSMKAFAKDVNDFVKEIIKVKEDGSFDLDPDTMMPQLTEKWKKIAEGIGSAFKSIFDVAKTVFTFLSENAKAITEVIEVYIGYRSVKAILAIKAALLESSAAFGTFGKAAAANSAAAAGGGVASGVGAVAGAAAGAEAGGAAKMFATGVGSATTAVVAFRAAQTQTAASMTTLGGIFKNFVSGTSTYGATFTALGAGLLNIGKAALSIISPFLKWGAIIAVIGGVYEAVKAFSDSTGTMSQKIHAAAGAFLDFTYQIPLLGDALHLVIHDWLDTKTATEEAAEAQKKADPSQLTQAYKDLSDSQKLVADEAIKNGETWRAGADGLVIITKSILDNANALDQNATKWDATRDAVAEAERALKQAKAGFGDVDSLRFEKSKAAIEQIGDLLKNEYTSEIQASVAAGHSLSKSQADDIAQQGKSIDESTQSYIKALKDVSNSSADTEKVLQNAFDSAQKFANGVANEGAFNDLINSLKGVKAPVDAFLNALSPEKFNAIEGAMGGLKEPIDDVSTALTKMSTIKLVDTSNELVGFGNKAKTAIGEEAVTSIKNASGALSGLNEVHLDQVDSTVGTWVSDTVSGLGRVDAALSETIRKFNELIAAQTQATTQAGSGANNAPGLQAKASGGSYNPGMVLVGEQGPEIIMTSEPGYVLNNRQTENMLKRATGGYAPSGTPMMVGEHGVEAWMKGGSGDCAGGDCGCVDCQAKAMSHRAGGGSLYPGVATMVGEAGREAFIPGGQFSYSRSGYQATPAKAASTKNDMAILPQGAIFDVDQAERDIWHYAASYKKETLDPAVHLGQVTRDQETLVMAIFRQVANDWRNYKTHGPAGQVGIAKASNGLYPYFSDVRRSESMYGYLGSFIAAAFGGGLAGDIENPWGTGVSSATASHKSALAGSGGSGGGTGSGTSTNLTTLYNAALKSGSWDAYRAALRDQRGAAAAMAFMPPYTGNEAFGSVESPQAYTQRTTANAQTADDNRRKNEQCARDNLAYAEAVYEANQENKAAQWNAVNKANGWPDQTFQYRTQGGGAKSTTGSAVNPGQAPVCPPDKPETPAPQGSYHGESYATGGDFMIPGTGGVDSQLVQFRGSPGEHVTISKPSHVRHGEDLGEDGSNWRGGGAHVEIHMHGVTDFNSFRRSERQMMSRLSKSLKRAQKGV